MKQTLSFLLVAYFITASHGQVYTGCNYEILYRHPADCTKYLQCSNGYEYVMTCPPNLVFNSIEQRCDFLENVSECQDVDVTTTTDGGFSTVCYTVPTIVPTTTTPMTTSNDSG